MAVPHGAAGDCALPRRSSANSERVRSTRELIAVDFDEPLVADAEVVGDLVEDDAPHERG